MNKNAIVVDLDGTTALLNGRNPFKYHLSGDDLVNEIVVNIIKQEKELGTTILFLSGRGLSSKKITQDWLNKHDIPYDKLDMKPDSDNRNSTFYKKEKVTEYLKEYNILYAIDDYIKVVEMFIEMGIPVIEIDEFTGQINNTHNIQEPPLF